MIIFFIIITVVVIIIAAFQHALLYGMAREVRNGLHFKSNHLSGNGGEINITAGEEWGFFF